MTRAYPNPLGLLHGAAAAEAVHRGWALPLAWGSAATGLEILVRDGGQVVTHRLPARDLPRWQTGAGRATSDEVAARLQRMSAGPLWPETWPAPPLLMGVVNVTPDSFYDGGRYREIDRAIEQGLRLAAEGAAIIDVGGESTRPGAVPVALEEEIRRTEPVVRALAGAGVLVSIDTRNAAVMRAAVGAGARMINDVTALSHDPDALAVAAASDVFVLLMHMQGEPGTMQQAPRYRRACLDVLDYLEARAAACVAAGIRRERLLIDPGVGFGKTLEHNLDIVTHLGLYRGQDLPLVLGVSRKSFIARLSMAEPADDRLPGSLAVVLGGGAFDAQILRVHDVAATRQALRVWHSLQD